jgi:hypothetical protein
MLRFPHQPATVTTSQHNTDGHEQLPHSLAELVVLVRTGAGLQQDDLRALPAQRCASVYSGLLNNKGDEMTAEKAAERQAARDNLVRELCKALESVRKFLKDPAIGTWQYMEGDGFYLDLADEVVKIDAAIARAKEQQ